MIKIIVPLALALPLSVAAEVDPDSLISTLYKDRLHYYPISYDNEVIKCGSE